MLLVTFYTENKSMTWITLPKFENKIVDYKYNWSQLLLKTK